MAKEELGYVRLVWFCPNCGSKNPGPQKTCISCGNPQPENIQFQQDEVQELITDADEIAKAKAGADIHCGFCGARNPATATVCSQCGGDLKEGKSRTSGQIVGAYQTGPEKQVPCPHCGALNPETAIKCAGCGASLSEPKPIPRPAVPPAQPAKKGMFIGILLIILAVICVAVLGFIFLLTRPSKSIEATIESVAWTRTISIEKLTPIERETWKEDIPPNAKIGTCEKKYKTTSQDPVPQATKVCGTPYVKDTGSGHGQVVQDCEYKVYADSCKYTVSEWRKTDEAVLKGTDYAPKWPEPKLTSDQRLGEKSELYTAYLKTAESKSYTYNSTDVNRFMTWKKGSKWIIKLNALDGVVSMEPVK